MFVLLKVQFLRLYFRPAGVSLGGGGGGGALGTPLGGAWSFLEMNIFVGKMDEINKWLQDIVEINILPTQEVEINII